MKKITKDKKGLKIIGIVCSFIIVTLAVLICFSIKWMFDTWINLSMDELIYHLTAPLEGTNKEMIWQYVRACVVPTVLIMTGITVLVLFERKREKPCWRVIAVVVVVISILAQTCSVYGAWKKLDISGYMANQGEVSTFIDDNYVDPRNVELTFPEQKRNLIYIFLESMEDTYGDTENGGGFEENVIPELTSLARKNEDFSGKDTTLNGGYCMPGATWTMGAMFGQTSGLPLNISIDGNAMDTQEKFFPEIITIGDILESAGYTQTLMMGSDATFGGRRNYFSQHGNYNIKDYNYAIEQGWIPEDYKVWWGV